MIQNIFLQIKVHFPKYSAPLGQYQQLFFICKNVLNRVSGFFNQFVFVTLNSSEMFLCL